MAALKRTTDELRCTADCQSEKVNFANERPVTRIRQTVRQSASREPERLLWTPLTNFRSGKLCRLAAHSYHLQFDLISSALTERPSQAHKFFA